MNKFPKLDPNRRLLPAVIVAAFAAVLTASADYRSAVTNLNPVGYWRLNEPGSSNIVSLVTGTATNYGSVGPVGNGRYYSVTNVGVEPSAVIGDTAPFLNPVGITNEYVEVDNLPQLLTNTSMSIECWVLRTNLSGTAVAFSGGCDTGAGTDYNGFLLFLDNANNGTRNYFLRVRCSTNGNTSSSISQVQYNARLFGLAGGTALGQWDHVVYTWNKTTISGYINGVALTNTTFPVNQWYHPNASRKIRFGGDSKLSPASLALRTWLAHAAIYPYELTYQQVTNHFAATNSAAAYKTAVLADSPVGYWPLNEAGPLAPASALIPVTCTNLGSWGAAADGVLAARDLFNTGAPGVPYPGFGGATCAKFPGGENGVIIPPQPLTASSFSISLWHKLPADAVAAHTKLFNSPNGVGSNCGLGFGQSSSPGMANNELGVTLTGPYIGAMSPRVYSPSNQWAFVTMVTDPSQTVLYVNGLAATNFSANTTTYGAHDFSLNSMLIGSGFAGSISDVAVFDYALTPEQVASLYAAAQVPATPTTLQLTAPDLNGDITVSGTTGRGLTARLWKSTDLTLGAEGWTEVGAANGDSVTGAFSFTNNVGLDLQGFFRVK